MAVTIAQIRAYAPTFADVTATPDALIQIMLDEALMRNDPDEWGLRYDIAVRYMTLHLLAVWYAAQPVTVDDEGNPIDPVPGEVGSVGSGAVKWEQVGTLQRGFAGPTATVGANAEKKHTDPYWESTIYGQMYTSMFAELMVSRTWDGYYPFIPGCETDY